MATKKKKLKFTIELEIDVEKLENKYPNYHINYDKPKDFVKTLVSELNQKEYGYNAKLIKTK